MKYTKEVLEPIVQGSKSFAEVIRKFGLRQSGGTQANLVRWVKIYKIDVSHFTGQAHGRGKVSPQRKHWTEVLVLRSDEGRKEHAHVLRRAMIESGILYVCECCGNLPEWQGKPLVLQVDHKNGDNLDNRRRNVRFLCPNCHSQTANFGSKNSGRVVKLAKALHSD